MATVRIAFMIALGGTCWAGMDLQAQEWSRFRGPNGSGLAAAPGPWTEKDRLWKVKLPGKGHASPVLWGNRLFITSGDKQTGQRLLFCLDAADGRTLWSRGFPVATHSQHPDNS